MTDLTRRDVLKGTLAAAAASLIPPRVAHALDRLETTASGALAAVASAGATRIEATATGLAPATAEISRRAAPSRLGA